MRRAIRSVLVLVTLVVAAASVTACSKSPTDVVQGDGYTNDH